MIKIAYNHKKIPSKDLVLKLFTPCIVRELSKRKEVSKSMQSLFFERIKLYSELSKFRLSSLVVVTSGAGFICAGAPLNLSSMISVCLGTALCAASASTFNQVVEREADANMKRTFNRPIPSGKVSVLEAISWGTLTGASGTALLFFGTNPVVAGLGLGNIALYAGLYTHSKKYSEINTWIGSVVGAVPPVMGWTAATGGSLLSAEPIVLASLLYLWQFPHFFALSWLHREDYARGKFQMVAVNDVDGQRSANLIMEHSLYLSILPLVTSLTGMTSYMFLVEGTIANAYLIYLAQKFRSERTNGNAKKIFLCSLWYLPVLLVGFVFHNRMWNDNESEEKDMVRSSVLRVKEQFKGMCLHEIIVKDEDMKAPGLCMKVVAEQKVGEVTKESKVETDYKKLDE